VAVPTGISPRGVRVWRYIRSGIDRGLSANAIIGVIRKHGLGYRRAIMLRDIRIARIDHDRRNALGRIPKINVISEEYYFKPRISLVPKRYVTKVAFDVYDPRTGLTERRDFPMGHDTLLRVGDIIDEVEKMMIEKYPELELRNFRIIDSWRGRYW